LFHRTLNPSEMSRPMMIDVDTEKMIVRNALLRLFNPTMTSALIEGFYAANPNMPQFLNPEYMLANASSSPSQSDDSHFPPSPPPMMLNEGPIKDENEEKPQFQLVVRDFPDTYFAKDYFPKFSVAVSPVDGAMYIPAELSEFQVTVSVHNKWADVTSEVLAAHTNLVRTVKDGVLDISDLIFIDVSLKHGGFFSLHVTPVDCRQVAPYMSPNFAIQSVKTHCNRKRKTREQAAVPMMEQSVPVKPVMAPLPGKSLGTFNLGARRMDNFVVNDAKSFLAPQTSLAMDAMDYGLSGGFFDMDADPLMDSLWGDAQ